MISLFVNEEPVLIDTLDKVKEREALELKKDPNADIRRQEPEKCGACGASYFYPVDSISCPCHDHY